MTSAPSPTSRNPGRPCPTWCNWPRCAWGPARKKSPLGWAVGGAAALKRLLTEALNERLRPIRVRRREVAADPGYLRQVLADGNERVRALAEQTLSQVQTLMHTRY